MLYLFLLVNPAIVFLRGNSKVKSILDNKKCTLGDLCILLGYLVFVIITTTLNSRRLIRYNKEIDLIENEKQIRLDSAKLFKMMTGVFFVSLVGTYISTGSTLIGLFLVYMGMTPFVAGPTSLIMSAMTSASSTFIYILNGQINFNFALVGALVILLFSLGTKVTVYKKLTRHGKESVIMLFMLLLIVISIPANLYKVIPVIVNDYKKGENILGFKGFCN